MRSGYSRVAAIGMPHDPAPFDFAQGEDEVSVALLVVVVARAAILTGAKSEGSQSMAGTWTRVMMNSDDLATGAQRDIETLVELLSAEIRKSLRNLKENELYKLHHGYGTWLRNQFRQGKLSGLFRSCDTQIAPENRSFDAISARAIREIWRHLSIQNR
ncbi:MAG TPA: DUF6794 domain-containing protein [Stellaceae bacterium]|nr:DUF6794 domain-containing protein [Stellaceae bacterium]